MRQRLEITEELLVAKIACWLEDAGYTVWKEVPNMGQSADLVAAKQEEVTICEAKLKDWKRALIQCQAHEAVADFIYIVIASKTVSPALVAAAESRGYGLIHFCRHAESIRIVKEAPRNNNFWPPQRHVWCEQWKQLTYEN